MISSKIELVVLATIKPNHLIFDCEKKLVIVAWCDESLG